MARGVLSWWLRHSALRRAPLRSELQASCLGRNCLHLEPTRPCCSASQVAMDGASKLQQLPRAGHVPLAFDPGQDGVGVAGKLTAEIVAVPGPGSFRLHFQVLTMASESEMLSGTVSLRGLRASFVCRVVL